MNTKIKLVMILAVIAVIGSLTAGVTTYADSGKYTRTRMVEYQNPDGSLIGNTKVKRTKSELWRNGDGIEANVDTRDLPEGAYTFWWLIFNNPDECDGPCDEQDLLVFNPDANPAINPSGLWGSAGIVGPDGKGYFNATLQQGELPGAVLFGPGLDNVKGSEIQVFMRYHGPSQFDDATVLGEQLTTFMGGCSAFNQPTGCYVPQIAIHKARDGEGRDRRR